MLCILLLWMLQQHISFHNLQSVCNQLDYRHYKLISRVRSHQVQRSQQTFRNFWVARDPIFCLNIQHRLQNQYQVIQFKDHFSMYELHIGQALSMCHFTRLQYDPKVLYHMRLVQSPSSTSRQSRSASPRDQNNRFVAEMRMKLKAARTRLNLTQHDVAILISAQYRRISQSAISRFETGSLRTSHLVSIAHDVQAWLNRIQ